MFTLATRFVHLRLKSDRRGAVRPMGQGADTSRQSRLSLERLEEKQMLATTPPLIGSEFQVNTYSDANQHFADVATNDAGSHVVAWQSDGQDGAGLGVYAQRFAADGTAIGSEFRVNATTVGSQSLPTVAIDKSGDFVVAWQSQTGSAFGVYAQQYASSGIPVGSMLQVSSVASTTNMQPAVAMDDEGNFVVAWNSNAGSTLSSIYAQQFAADGTPLSGEFQVNSTSSSSEVMPSVAMDDTGNFVITWQGYHDSDGYGIFAQRYAADGTPLGSEFQVNTFTPSHQTLPEVAADAAGNAVIVWQSSNQDGSGTGIFGRRIAFDGTPLGSEFKVNSTTSSNQVAPTVATTSLGQFVVAWGSLNQDGSSYGVYGQRFDSDGSMIGDEFPVNTFTGNVQNRSSTAIDDAGNFIITWESNGQDGSGYGVYGQRFALLGETISDVVLFEDSFEASEWNGLWHEDSQNDWFPSAQRATDGNRSAEVDGKANNATLTQLTPLDLSGYMSVELTFDWLIESALDNGEYVTLDVFDGTSWNYDVRRLNGNASAENVWHAESVDLSPYMSTGTLVRFRAKMSDSSEDANVDNVRIEAGLAPSEATAMPAAAMPATKTLVEAATTGLLANLSSPTGARSRAFADCGLTAKNWYVEPVVVIRKRGAVDHRRESLNDRSIGRATSELSDRTTFSVSAMVQLDAAFAAHEFDELKKA